MVTIAAQSSRRWSPPRGLRRAAGPLIFVAVWQLVCSLGWVSEHVLVGPATVVSTGWDTLQSGLLTESVLASLGRVVVGALIGISAGLALGLAAGLYRLGEDLVDSTVQMLRTVPFVGLIPLLIAWFGIGDAPKYALIALGTAYPVYLNVYAGIRHVDAGLVECAETLGANRRTLVRHVVLPSALPNLFVGLRHSLGIAWIALIFAEQVNTSRGLGWMMKNAQTYGQTDVIILCLAIYALLGLTIDLFIRLLERWTLAWRPTFTGR